MSNIFFTSDLHLNHRNVIQYSARPWESVEEMNDALISRWNQRVKPNDTVYLLGDFTLTTRIELVDEWLGRLNGTIRLIKGNHDVWVKKFDRLKNKHKIKWIKDYAEKTFTPGGNKYKIVMCHFPLLSWHGSHWDKGRGATMIHGHTHGSIQSQNEKVRRYDVGVDCNDWYPLSLDEIVVANQNKPLLDHHNMENN